MAGRLSTAGGNQAHLNSNGLGTTVTGLCWCRQGQLSVTATRSAVTYPNGRIFACEKKVHLRIPESGN